jgi:hypothetical protein
MWGTIPNLSLVDLILNLSCPHASHYFKKVIYNSCTKIYMVLHLHRSTSNRTFTELPGVPRG